MTVGCLEYGGCGVFVPSGLDLEQRCGEVKRHG
jgi:hypothetical protein